MERMVKEALKLSRRDQSPKEPELEQKEGDGGRRPAPATREGQVDEERKCLRAEEKRKDSDLAQERLHLELPRPQQLEQESRQLLELEEERRRVEEEERERELEQQRLRRLEEEGRERERKEQTRRANEATRLAALAAKAAAEEEQRVREEESRQARLRQAEEERENQRRLATERDQRAREQMRVADVARRAAVAKVEEERQEGLRLHREAQEREDAKQRRERDRGEPAEGGVIGTEAATPVKGQGEDPAGLSPAPLPSPTVASSAVTDRDRAREEAWAEARMIAEQKARRQAMRTAASREGTGRGVAAPEARGAVGTTATETLLRARGTPPSRIRSVSPDTGSSRQGSVGLGALDSAGPPAVAAPADTWSGGWGGIFSGGRQARAGPTSTSSVVSSSQVSGCAARGLSLGRTLRRERVVDGVGDRQLFKALL